METESNAKGKNQVVWPHVYSYLKENPGAGATQIAKAIGFPRKKVLNVLSRGRREGWLSARISNGESEHIVIGAPGALTNDGRPKPFPTEDSMNPDLGPAYKAPVVIQEGPDSIVEAVRCKLCDWLCELDDDAVIRLALEKGVLKL